MSATPSTDTNALALRKILRGKSTFSIPSVAVDAAQQSKGEAVVRCEPVVIIALDCSGSMGLDFQLAVRGCRMIEDKYFIEGGLRQLQFVTFGETVQATEHLPSTYVNHLALLERKSLEGETWLTGVMDHIRGVVEQEPSIVGSSKRPGTSGSSGGDAKTDCDVERPVNILVLTDGQNTKGSSYDVDRALTALSETMRKCHNGRIDCIGFTSGHDVRILNRLVQCSGSTAGQGGTFQYAATGEQLPAVLEKLAVAQTVGAQIVATLTGKCGDQSCTTRLVLSRSSGGGIDDGYEGTVENDGKTIYDHLEIGTTRFAIEVHYLIPTLVSVRHSCLSHVTHVT
jgi:hypothetical protein